MQPQYNQQYNQQYQQQPPQYSQPYAQPQYTQNFYAGQITEAQLPENLKPLSPWAYIGYSILMAIPVVGFICMLLFSFSSSGNINRRNFARSMLYMLVIGVVIAIFIAVLAAVLGFSLAGLGSLYY